MEKEKYEVNIIEELINRVFELEMELFQERYNFEYEKILTEIKENLLKCTCISNLHDIITEFGFKRVEDWFINKKRLKYENKIND